MPRTLAPALFGIFLLASLCVPLQSAMADSMPYEAFIGVITQVEGPDWRVVNFLGADLLNVTLTFDYVGGSQI